MQHRKTNWNTETLKRSQLQCPSTVTPVFLQRNTGYLLELHTSYNGAIDLKLKNNKKKNAKCFVMSRIICNFARSMKDWRLKDCKI